MPYYTRPPSQLFQQQGHHLSYYYSSRSRITCCHSSYSYCLLLAAFFTCPVTSIHYYTPIRAIAVAATVTATQLFILPTRQIFGWYRDILAILADKKASIPSSELLSWWYDCYLLLPHHYYYYYHHVTHILSLSPLCLSLNVPAPAVPIPLYPISGWRLSVSTFGLKILYHTILPPLSFISHNSPQ